VRTGCQWGLPGAKGAWRPVPRPVRAAAQRQRKLGFAGPRTGSWLRAWPGKDRGLRVRPWSGHPCGKNQSKSAPICGRRDVGVAAPAPGPTAAQSQPILLEEPVAWQRFSLTSPTLGRRLGTVGQVAGRGQAEKSSKEVFTTEAGRTKNGRDEANGFIGRREPLAYHPKMGR